MVEPRVTEAIPARVVNRVLAAVVMGPNGCHVSTRAVNGGGYAAVQWRDGGRSFYTTAHRVAWIGMNGPIQDGLTVDHQCKNKRCINVHHLRLLTHSQNAARRAGEDWPLDECRNGHKLAEHWRPRELGTRGACRRCRQDIQNAARAADPERKRSRDRERRARLKTAG